jgi:hypothetical protein
LLLSTQEIVDLVRPIVEDEMPHQVLAFDLSASDFAEDLVNPHHKAPHEHPEHFGFSGAKEAVEVLECFKLLAAVYGVCETLRGWSFHRRDSVSDVRECLIDYLKKQDISDTKARRMTERLITRLLSSINKAHAKEE